MLLSEGYRKRLQELAGLSEYSDAGAGAGLNYSPNDVRPLDLPLKNTSVNTLDHNDEEINYPLDEPQTRTFPIQFSTDGIRVNESKEKKPKEPKAPEIKNPIHLPELAIGKGELLKYLKDVYGIKLSPK